MMQGESLVAREKSACTSFGLSPYHLLRSDDAETERKFADVSFAIALASSVLPVPGGP
jgi:hypothetical protein